QQLRGAEDRRRLRWHGVAVRPGELWRAPDPPAVVKALVAAIDLVAVDVEPEQPASGDEEGPPFVEERFVRRQVEHRWIGLDLPEVRVDRTVQRQVRRDAILEVAAEGGIRARDVAVVGNLR